MKVIAHRGACTEALENSWSAFHRSVEGGAERIELDIHLTSDGHMVVIHDEDLKRTAGQERPIHAVTRKDIEGNIRLTNGEKIPFLDELFEELLPKVELNVEIKPAGRPIVEALAKLMKTHPLKDKIIVSCFHEATCAQLAAEHKDFRVALLWDRSLWWPGALSFGPIRFMKEHGIRIYHPDARLVTPGMVKRMKKLGWEVFPYIGLRRETEKEQLWSYLMAVGVDGLCTNFPRQLKLWLQEAKDDEERFRNKDRLVRQSS